MKKRNRCFRLFACFAALCLALIGCHNPSTQARDISLADILDRMIIPSDMLPRPDHEADAVAKQFGLDEKALLEYAHFLPDSSISAKEILILKCQPEEQESIKALLEKYRTNQIDKWKDYLPESAHLVQKGQIAVHDPFVLMVIHDDSAQVVDAFRHAMD